MKQRTEKSRRNFIGNLALGTATGLASLTTLGNPLAAIDRRRTDDAESWFRNAHGKHRIVYDASEPHDGYSFIWSWVFYMTNNETGTPDDDMTAMVVLRHNAIPFAMEDRLWARYKLGEFFGIKDNTTGAPALRNPYYVPKDGDFPAPAIEGLKRLQERGAMFCVCSMALWAYSLELASQRGLDHQEVLNDWKSGILAGVQVVPSGVWAIGRAQEHGFAYCYAGG